MNNDKETTRLWMPVKGYEESYDIDMLTGELRSHYTSDYQTTIHGKPCKARHHSNKIIRGTKMGRGFMQVVISKDHLPGNGKFRYNHDLVAELAWELPVPQENITKHVRRVQVIHLDGNKLNNAWWNLSWRVLVGDLGDEEFGRAYWYPPRKMTKQFKKLLKKSGLEDVR